MWALIVSITLNLQAYPMFDLSDNVTQVYMRTTTFRVALAPPGGFATKAACETYQGAGTYLAAEMNFSFMQNSNSPPPPVIFQNVPMNVVGCEKVL
jgi:hypothetical protein